ncbi:IQ and ubiquitin-like domain-containing protein isoform X3 [Pogoniulus pusillus]|uniref:IQ and ubiquitin-like domain-containing protein isoform X3 n=1 Tax=Pogoniulus pusillus TaxID=488313 RepID=UPI0030B984A8
MDNTSDSCLDVATTEKSGAEQPSASSESPVCEAENGSPAEKLLLSEATGSTIKDDEALRRARANADETIQSEKLQCDQEDSPGKAVQQDYHMPDVITVRVQRDSDSFQDVVVKIERPIYHKPFVGGFKNKITGVEFHNAGAQTIPKPRPDRGVQVFCRETQTVYERNKPQQTKNTTSTQMTKVGLYVSSVTDKLISPAKYLTAEEYHKRRLEAVIVLQTYFRRWHAVNVVRNLRELKGLRLAWEAQEELQRKKEKEEKLRREHERRLNPKTKEDFELLYHAVELWRQEETEQINRSLTGAERKAALCGLLDQEAQLIASIGRHKLHADEENQQKAILRFLDKCAQPKRWKAYDGKITEMDTQDILRARELFEIYCSISMNGIPKDERRDVLLTLRRTVKEHECKLTREIVELIDREVDLMSREVKECNLEGLRKRICTLFLQYTKIPEFNPEVARILKHQDLQYLVETIWGCQSALSVCNDLYDLVMVRWDKQHEWSPWNTILLTENEADAHLKLCSLEKAYEATFIDGIKDKHTQAKKYFAQFPAMASFLQRSDNQANANEFLIATVTNSSILGKTN